MYYLDQRRDVNAGLFLMVENEYPYEVLYVKI